MYFPRLLFAAIVVAFVANELPASAQESKGRLLVLSVGVEPALSAKGKNDPYSRDAGHVAAALEAAKPLFKSVHAEVVNGNTANYDAVRNALRQLVRKQQADDLAVVFFSCHGGWTAKGGYNISLAKVGKDWTQLAGGELLDILGSSKGRVIVFLDTCAAGGVIPAMPRMSYTNVSFIVACRRDEGSSGSGPSTKKPHGCFVVALTEALKGRADANQDGIVTLGEVNDYVPGRAKEMYNEQNAVSLIRPGAVGIQLAKTAEGTKPGKPEPESGTRNPFGMVDIDRPLGKDVAEFARDTRLPGGKRDSNAEDWATIAVPKTEDVDGRWSSRWKSGDDGEWTKDGTAVIKIAGDRVFIMYFDGSGRYMIEARRSGEQRLVGRYINLNDEGDTSPWVGRIVDNGRIDGAWSGGRWDFRRNWE